MPALTPPVQVSLLRLSRQLLSPAAYQQTALLPALHAIAAAAAAASSAPSAASAHTASPGALLLLLLLAVLQAWLSGARSSPAAATALRHLCSRPRHHTKPCAAQHTLRPAPQRPPTPVAVVLPLALRASRASGLMLAAMTPAHLTAAHPQEAWAWVSLRALQR